MGIYIFVSQNKQDLGGIDLGYGSFFHLRNEIATLNGFAYHTKMTKMHNPYFNKELPENDMTNSRYIPEFTAPIWLSDPTQTTLTKVQMRHLRDFLVASDVEGKITRPQIRSIWMILKDHNSSNPNIKDNYNKFKHLVKIANEHNQYIKWY